MLNCIMGLFWVCYLFIHWLLRGCTGNWVWICLQNSPVVQFHRTKIQSSVQPQMAILFVLLIHCTFHDIIMCNQMVTSEQFALLLWTLLLQHYFFFNINKYKMVVPVHQTILGTKKKIPEPGSFFPDPVIPQNNERSLEDLYHIFAS